MTSNLFCLWFTDFKLDFVAHATLKWYIQGEKMFTHCIIIFLCLDCIDDIVLQYNNKHTYCVII